MDEQKQQSRSYGTDPCRRRIGQAGALAPQMVWAIPHRFFDRLMLVNETHTDNPVGADRLYNPYIRIGLHQPLSNKRPQLG